MRLPFLRLLPCATPPSGSLAKCLDSRTSIRIRSSDTARCIPWTRWCRDESGVDSSWHRKGGMRSVMGRIALAYWHCTCIQQCVVHYEYPKHGTDHTIGWASGNPYPCAARAVVALSSRAAMSGSRARHQILVAGFSYGCDRCVVEQGRLERRSGRCLRGLVPQRLHRGGQRLL
jgi:hypothetical protein